MRASSGLLLVIISKTWELYVLNWGINWSDLKIVNVLKSNLYICDGYTPARHLDLSEMRIAERKLPHESFSMRETEQICIRDNTCLLIFFHFGKRQCIAPCINDFIEPCLHSLAYSLYTKQATQLAMRIYFIPLKGIVCILMRTYLVFKITKNVCIYKNLCCDLNGYMLL